MLTATYSDMELGALPSLPQRTAAAQVAALPTEAAPPSPVASLVTREMTAQEFAPPPRAKDWTTALLIGAGVVAVLGLGYWLLK
jgi:hypothetical protein